MWHFFQEHFLWFGFAFYGGCLIIFIVLYRKHLHEKGIYWNGSPEVREAKKKIDRLMAEERQKKENKQ